MFDLVWLDSAFNLPLIVLCTWFETVAQKAELRRKYAFCLPWSETTNAGYIWQHDKSQKLLSNCQ